MPGSCKHTYFDLIYRDSYNITSIEQVEVYKKLKTKQQISIVVSCTLKKQKGKQ